MLLPYHLVGVMATQVPTISQWQLQHVWVAALEMAVAGNHGGNGNHGGRNGNQTRSTSSVIPTIYKIDANSGVASRFMTFGNGDLLKAITILK